MGRIIDLRSDTVTKPSAEMRRAMAEAEVGDDIYEDDPTVNLLQERCAPLLGKEAALFMPSGTMSNAAAVACHTKPGDEILLDGDAHSMLYELGVPAVFAGALTRQFPSEAGVPQVRGIRDLIHTESLHSPGTTLIVLENTHNRAGGAVIPIAVMAEIRSIAADRGIRVHLDGARLFNAAIAARVPAARFAKYADTVTFCLSKGLGCPIGSVLCGSREFIHRARRMRKMLGGGMRQVGILAAAGLYALKHNIERLAEDHRNCSLLASSLEGAPGISLRCAHPPTNMVYINTTRPAGGVCDDLKRQHNVLCTAFGPNLIRLVTHMDVDEKDIGCAAAAIRSVAAKS